MMTREEENARIRERYRAARGGKLQTVRSQDEPDDDEVGGDADGLAPAEPPNSVEDPDPPATRPPRRMKRPRAAVIDGSVVQAILESAPTSGEGAGFTMGPNLLIHGEGGARLERRGRGTAWLMVVLLRYAEREDHKMWASKATLRRLTGIAKDETLDRRLWLLTRRHKGLGLPALLRKLPGAGVHYAFREDGIVTLAGQARRAVDQQALRLAAIRKAQSRGGTKGMQTRWAKSRAAHREKSYATTGTARDGITRHSTRRSGNK